jgi:hypothetical protein
LLARASDLRIASPLTPPDGTVSTPGTWLTGSEHGPYMDVQRFFLPMKANLDQGPGLDPVEVGLVTVEEAEMLLAYFHKHLAHTRKYLFPFEGCQDSLYIFELLLHWPYKWGMRRRSLGLPKRRRCKVLTVMLRLGS